MATVTLSNFEREFIKSGILSDFRADGRSCKDYRSFEIKKGVISNTNGSAQLHLGSTTVLVGVKAELGVPRKVAPDQGKVEFFVDCSALASPEFEGRVGDDLGGHLTQLMQSVYCSGQCLDLKSLCIVPAKACWTIYIDALVVEWGGNVLDALSLAVRSALSDTRIPKLQTSGEEEIEVEVVDDPMAFELLSLKNVPLVVTLTLIGDQLVVDATQVEESCSSAQLVMSVKQDGEVCSISKSKSEGILRTTLIGGIEMAQGICVQLFDSLQRRL